jgi:hypothetical protein
MSARSTHRAWFGPLSSGLFLLLGATGLAWGPACARLEQGGVEIVTSGVHSVEVGATIALMAETLRGTDHAYDWTSEDETIATVSADGTVTGTGPSARRGARPRYGRDRRRRIFRGRSSASIPGPGSRP